MALRSRTSTGTSPRVRSARVTSGPGRGPASDGRVRHRRGAHDGGRSRAGQRRASEQELRRRAELIFAERGGDWRESGTGPPGAGDVVDVVDPSGPGDPGARGLRGRLGPALRERMPVWVQARCGLERRSVIALVALLALAAALAVHHFWAGRVQPVRAPEVVRAAASHGDATRDGAAAESGATVSAGPGAAGSPGAEIVVDVGGKVRDPGVHRLPAGSRVADALRAAGGVRPGTDMDGLNQARFLVDGEQVIVGAPPGAAGAAPAAETGGATGPGGAPTAPVSLNTATLEQLDTLPGVGPVLAQHIIDHRTRHGGFRSVDELRDVNGIGDRRFADLRNLVRP
ncbi:ComEA family DNA-binding protein [Streptomyces sp. SS1-1]|uniref:ComEA family DNA-binding protein n=1 Tax=Streptomyces sp. SS1-1 TaxID=2651869 RepID=UPI00124FF7E2|nr:ComEA family DNA-binding protein [Streptomyces sp. SS1-1]KAB2972682.1 ComEA family DNA-binding protein [Streptomyces sp. SS1-1]